MSANATAGLKASLGRRELTPELLDRLPAHDPRAVRSRRDLVRVNAVMGNARVLTRLLCHNAERPPRRLVDLGAGDGALALALAKRLAPLWPGVECALLDLKPAATQATLSAIEAVGWKPRVVTADVLDGLEDAAGGADAIVANLFLHHFEDDALRGLLARVADVTPLFVACEPERSGLALAGSRMLWALGCNDVSRHDAVVSVKAGFAGDEISNLWREREGWRLSEGRAGPFGHKFSAARV